MKYGLGWMAVVASLGLGACGSKTAGVDAALQQRDTEAPTAVVKPIAATTTEADTAVAQAPTPLDEADAVAAPVAAEGDTAAPAAVAADGAAAPAPGEATAAVRAANEQGVEVPGAGVVALERLSALAPVDGAQRAMLPRVPRCGAHPDDDGCGFVGLLGVVGFKEDQVALITTPRIESCAEADAMAGRVATLADLGAGKAQALVDPEGDEEPSARRAWTWLGKVARDGFRPTADLIVAAAEQPSGIRAHTPTVMLGAPLAGWLIDAGDGTQAAAYRLVSPDNKVAHPLGEIAHVKGACEGEDRDEGLCADFTAASVHQVVLTADGKRLIVTTALGDGTHCGSDLVTHSDWPLPAGVTPAP